MLHIITNVSGKINSTIFGLDESAVISTYYFRLRTFDVKNNFAEWSGPLSASYINPLLYVSISEQQFVNNILELKIIKIQKFRFNTWLKIAVKGFKWCLGFSSFRVPFGSA